MQTASYYIDNAELDAVVACLYLYLIEYIMDC
jgi:hypothetical protein